MSEIELSIVMRSSTATSATRCCRSWGSGSFWHLDPTRMLRLVIPAVTAVTLGAEVVPARFFLSLLRLRRR